MLDAFSIPPVHIFAPETHSPHIAFSLVAAHPERVASLTLLGGASIKEASYQQFMETAPLHLNPWHPEGFMEVMSVLASLYYGPDHETIPPDTLDALVDADARICINRPETLYMFWRGFLEVGGLSCRNMYLIGYGADSFFPARLGSRPPTSTNFL